MKQYAIAIFDSANGTNKLYIVTANKPEECIREVVMRHGWDTSETDIMKLLKSIDDVVSNPIEVVSV